MNSPLAERVSAETDWDGSECVVSRVQHTQVIFTHFKEANCIQRETEKVLSLQSGNTLIYSHIKSRPTLPNCGRDVKVLSEARKVPFESRTERTLPSFNEPGTFQIQQTHLDFPT